MGSSGRKLVQCVVLLSLSLPARADDQAQSGDLAREQLARVIAVLRLKPEAAGQSCLDALHEAHQTEDQLKKLETKAKDPDLALAQDVLETDYENAQELCGADARRTCVSTQRTAGMTSACDHLIKGG